MRLHTATSTGAFGQVIKRVMRSQPYLIIWRRAIGGEEMHLYGSSVSEEAALAEAQQDCPLGELVQRIEYLSPDKVAALRQKQAKDPLAQTLEDLGVIK